jgi:hypothetical protein
MRIKNIITLCVLLLSCCLANAQQNTQEYLDQADRYKRFMADIKDKTLLVVVDDSTSDYGKSLVQGFNSFWHLTKVQYITSSEIHKYVELPGYALFSLLIRDYAVHLGSTEGTSYGPGAGAAGGSVRIVHVKHDLKRIIYPDSLPINANNPEYLKKHSDWHIQESVEFDFLLCGDYLDDTIAHSINSLKLCDNYPLYVQTNPSLPLKVYEPVASPYVVQIIRTYQQQLQNKIESKKPFETLTKKKVSYQREGKEKTETVRVYEYDGGLAQAQGKKIYVDSSFISKEQVQLVSGALGVSDDNIIRIGGTQTAAMFKSNDSNTLILTHDSPDSWGHVMYILYTTNGVELALFEI